MSDISVNAPALRKIWWFSSITYYWKRAQASKRTDSLCHYNPLWSIQGNVLQSLATQFSLLLCSYQFKTISPTLVTQNAVFFSCNGTWAPWPTFDRSWPKTYSLTLNCTPQHSALWEDLLWNLSFIVSKLQYFRSWVFIFRWGLWGGFN